MTPEIESRFEHILAWVKAGAAICALEFPALFHKHGSMHLEHTAYNVPAPAAAAEWYSQNLGMSVPRKFGPPAHGHFLASNRGQVMLEFYNNPNAPIPDYASINPLTLHLAFAVEDLTAIRAHLLSVGATPVGEISTNDDGDQLAMLRDPWGIPLQLVKRAKSIL